MKKILLLMALVISANVFAQDKVFRIGFKFGTEIPISSSLEFYDGYSYNDFYGLRLDGGAVFNISFTEKFGLQPEILVQYRDDFDESVYLMIPIMFDIKPFGHGFSIQAGPRLGTSIYVDQYYDDYYYDEYDDFYYYDLGGAFSDFDLGAQVGVQYVAPFHLFTSLRLGYSYSTGYEDGVLSLGVSLGMLF